MEIFKPIPIELYSDTYSISNYGRVRVDVKSVFSRNKSDFLTPAFIKGYPLVGLYANGKQRNFYIHRLVAMAFLAPAPSNKPFVCHKDDDPSNPRFDNLYWGNNTDNMRDMVKRGRSLKGEKNGRAILTKEKADEIRKIYAETKISQQKLAERYGVSQTQVSKLLLNKLWV